MRRPGFPWVPSWFAVQDTGIGIPVDLLDHLVRAFFQMGLTEAIHSERAEPTPGSAPLSRSKRRCFSSTPTQARATWSRGSWKTWGLQPHLIGTTAAATRALVENRYAPIAIAPRLPNGDVL